MQLRAKAAVLLANLALLAMPLAAACSAYAAADWPSRPVRITVTFTAGGTNDTLTRILSSRLTTLLGQPIVIDNVPGGAGLVGTAAVARATADGYTLLMANASSLVTNRFLHKRLDYDPDGFVPVSLVARFPLILIGHPSAPGDSLAGFVSFARANPGGLSYASFGMGSVSHFQMEMFKLAAGIDLLHVPFKGAADAMPAVISGNVQAYFTTTATGITHYKAGKVKAYGVTGRNRLRSIPDVPTFVEQGFADVDLPAWMGLVAPRGTPADVTDKLRSAVNKALGAPDLADRFAELGADTAGGTPEQFSALVRSDLQRYERLVKTLGITAQ